MKIVHICLTGPFTDGWNYQENVLTKYHAKAGNDVVVLSSRWIWGTDGKLKMDPPGEFVNADGVRVIRLEMRGKENFGNRFKTYPALMPELVKAGPDVLFIHGVAFCDISVLVRYLKAHPHVIAYADNHADLTNSGTNWLSRNILHGIIWKHYARSLVPYVKKFYGVLPVRVDFLKDVYELPENKCELLVMGADDELVQAAAGAEVRHRIRARYGIADDDFLVMTGGKIDQWKTQTLLLMEAVRKIEDERVKLIVFGSVTPELKEQVASLTDGRKVQFIGWVRSGDSYQYFAASDLVVFPGRHSVFWEQVAAQGIPMLCKDMPGTHHVDLGGNVRFLKHDSAEEIMEEIERLVRHPEEYRKMKTAAVEKGMRAFSYRDIAKRAIEQ